MNLLSKGKSGQPLIIGIEGNSREDGPGTRSVIFFKGCLLNCLWCQNPESKKSTAELWWDSEKCIDCGDCIKACPQNAISKESPSFIDRAVCDLCFKCVGVCPSGALRRVGKPMGVEEIVQKVLRYKPFFDASDGGVTLTGGEPTLYMDFSSQLLRALKTEDIHTTIETAGLFELERFISVILPFVDLIYFDIKVIDPVEHKKLTGVGNEEILRNFEELHERSLSEDFEIIPRIPLIPGRTDQEANIEDLAKFFHKNKVEKAALLPNNPAWLQKLDKIGLPTPFDQNDPIRKFYDEVDEQKIKDNFSGYGIEVSSGG